MSKNQKFQLKSRIRKPSIHLSVIIGLFVFIVYFYNNTYADIPPPAGCAGSFVNDGGQIETWICVYHPSRPCSILMPGGYTINCSGAGLQQLF